MIELRNASFSYENGGEGNGILNMNLTIKKGEVVLLCGESGCGKTTLTRLINGLIPHYYKGTLTGEVMIGGKEVHKLPLYETAKVVGSVFQNPRSQFFNVDTTSELAFGCENIGLPVDEIERRISNTVAEMRIESLMDRSIFNLSGGEKQKIASASVSTSDPEVFVLDEPSSNLDAIGINDLMRMIETWKRKGKTIVVAEHRLYYLRELADRVIYLKKGQIEMEMSMSQMKKMTAEELMELGLRPLYLESLKGSEQDGLAGDYALRFDDFTFEYKKNSFAIHIGSLAVPRGAVVALVGYNGAGKTTLARCLCGLEKTCKGKVYVCGKECRCKERLRRCYMVMQDVNHQLFTESVLDEVLLSMKEENAEKAERILDRLDLLPYKTRHPMSLSGGQKQRVAIASAVACEKDIILFDEPTSGLDLRHMREVSDNIKSLAEMDKTLLVLSHDLELILSCCTHILHLEKGKVKADYPLDDCGLKKLIEYFIECA